ncbi:type II secretion system F family protein [Pseudomonas songnenensis]|jgi:tight adherence protein C|uniref:Type II secretion system F family protein n=1 Tax=Pseudomonas songnenensis TaxID=1176259 RepID=A0A482TZ12_9PSED|nr:type II secretion system F family protein [Pseudomonas songnenensis]MCQ4299422.1 type II secretion system F family protein [Pseudomonas songnenensis]RMH94303.1 type II secretion system F family protein [Pseudomonas songnenensis]RYJ59480.1 type II secretion system F family protein [Pseudomonas songnenensis]
MDYLWSVFNGLMGDERWVRLLFLAAIGISVVIAALTLTMLVVGLQDPVHRRLVTLKRGMVDQGVGEPPRGNLQLLLAQLGDRLVATDSEHASGTRALLLHAGYRSANAAQLYWSLRLLLPLLLLAAAVVVLPLFSEVEFSTGLMLTAAAVVAGWMIPAMYVEKRKEARMNRLRAAFPDALDLLVVCVESGLALPQAIERVAEETSVSHAELAGELALVNAEIRAGVSSSDALQNLALRTGLEDLQGLVSLLGQSIRFGTSVADTLRIYAEEFRDRRTQAAEEQAAKIGTKLVFPLILCLWPSFFVVAIGPAIMALVNAFGSS